MASKASTPASTLPVEHVCKCLRDGHTSTKLMHARRHKRRERERDRERQTETETQRQNKPPRPSDRSKSRAPSPPPVARNPATPDISCSNLLRYVAASDSCDPVPVPAKLIPADLPSNSMDPLKELPREPPSSPLVYRSIDPLKEPPSGVVDPENNPSRSPRSECLHYMHLHTGAYMCVCARAFHKHTQIIIHTLAYNTCTQIHTKRPTSQQPRIRAS